MTILPHLPEELIHAAYAKAAGKELESGKFNSPESSAALAANVFGYFCAAGKAPEFPRHGHFPFLTTPVESLNLERSLRFPWSGGRHPWLDAVIETRDWLVGIESKRFEPFRDTKSNGFSDAYDRDMWGPGMRAYDSVREAIKSGAIRFKFLDAVQLVKHAYGICTQARTAKKAALVYVYAEPRCFPGGRVILNREIGEHRDEIRRFTDLVSGAEVRFSSLSHASLNEEFAVSESPDLVLHAKAVRAAFLSEQYS